MGHRERSCSRPVSRPIDRAITGWLYIKPSLLGYLLVRSTADILFAALGDPTRRAIFQRLSREGEQTVHALTSHSGVSQPAVSKHLAVLKRAGLVKQRRAGRETHYRARMEGLAPLVDWMSLYGAFWRERLDALENLLGRMDQ